MRTTASAAFPPAEPNRYCANLRAMVRIPALFPSSVHTWKKCPSRLGSLVEPISRITIILFSSFRTRLNYYISIPRRYSLLFFLYCTSHVSLQFILSHGRLTVNMCVALSFLRKTIFVLYNQFHRGIVIRLL